jgi:hypothetical protein
MSETNELLSQLIGKVDSLNSEIKTEFGRVNDRLTEVEKSLVKLDERIAGIDKRLSNEETISRTALGAIFGGVSIAAIKYLFFPN